MFQRCMGNKTETILVTGGAGFIGTHLVDALLKKGYRVRVLDNLSLPTHDGNLPPWFPKGAEFIKGDVRMKDDWTRVLDGVDYIFHQAGYMDTHPDFSTYFSVNAFGTALLYEVITEKKLPIKKIIAASSQSVYGEGKYYCSNHGIEYPLMRDKDQLERGEWDIRCIIDNSLKRPLPEDEDDELHPSTPYGVSKLALEKIVLTLGEQYNIPSVILRYSIVHGPHQSFRHYYSGALRQFVAMALLGKDIAFHEDGMQLRDFVHVRDVVTAHLLVMRSDQSDFQTFNVGSGEPTKIIDLAKTVAEVAHVPFQQATQTYFRFGSPRNAFMKISKLRKLGWDPQHSLQDNVRDYIDWVKQYPEAKKYFHDALK